MKTIEIIRPISLDIYKLTADKPVNAPVITGILGFLSKMGILVLPSIIFLLGFGFLVFGIFPENGAGTDWETFLIGLLCTIVGFFWLSWILKGGIYKPGKSFYWWRLTKDKIQSIYKIVTVIVVILGIFLLLIKFSISVLVALIGVISGIFVLSQSFKVHENVDYVANQELTDRIGMEVDEKVQASYLKKNIIMLLTDKKIIFAYQEKKQWNVLNKKIEEISKIGVYTPMMLGSFFNTDLSFVLLFTDSTKVELKMDLFNKITSNPDLFFKKFLTTLDDVLLGKTDVKITSRRRVSVNKDSLPSVSVNKESTNQRTIDLSDTLLKNLRDATPIEAGRTLEF
jgi:hypothetical protein